MRRARIICTIGPASSSLEVMEAMLIAGMDVARLNFSHGTHEEHRARVELLRKASRNTGIPLALMQDVQGPKIRLGRFEGGSCEVKTGDVVTLTTRKVLGGGGVLPTPITSLTRDVRKGDPVLLDDGRVRLEVQSVRGKDVKCRVLVGGLLKDHKGLNLPGAAVSVPTLTRKDIVDLAFGQELGVDYVALSFVRSAKDIELARKHVRKLGTPLIAKIEKPQAIQALDAIAAASDGVMVARGDLGVEMPLAQLPGLQKEAVTTVNRRGGLVIVATEMLESMINSPRPTRAEVSDVANAIFDGTDAVMLSGETAVGRYPVETIRMMASVVVEAEKRVVAHASPFASTTDISTGVAIAAVSAADRLDSAVLVAFTESGHTARLISELRPRARIVALTPHEDIVRRMRMYWGVTPCVAPRLTDTDAMIEQVKKLVLAQGWAKRGETVVIVAGTPLGKAGNTNLMTVRRL
ncbi:MAG: pyruvate kinase [Archangium gephyra]|uniref:Pyruvate kinase n=1 Tax=Archangium gephyra TaxID=48 RepID=A0A2W5TUM1_9BACT|nr:MAG: pyruvate kinase [Archangium gephyra]